MQLQRSLQVSKIVESFLFFLLKIIISIKKTSIILPEFPFKYTPAKCMYEL